MATTATQAICRNGLLLSQFKLLLVDITESIGAVRDGNDRGVYRVVHYVRLHEDLLYRVRYLLTCTDVGRRRCSGHERDPTVITIREGDRDQLKGEAIHECPIMLYVLCGT